MSTKRLSKEPTMQRKKRGDEVFLPYFTILMHPVKFVELYAYTHFPYLKIFKNSKIERK